MLSFLALPTNPTKPLRKSQIFFTTAGLDSCNNYHLLFPPVCFFPFQCIESFLENLLVQTAPLNLSVIPFLSLDLYGEYHFPIISMSIFYEFHQFQTTEFSSSIKLFNSINYINYNKSINIANAVYFINSFRSINIINSMSSINAIDYFVSEIPLHE